MRWALLLFLSLSLAGCPGSGGGNSGGGPQKTSRQFGPEGEWPSTYLCHSGKELAKVKMCIHDQRTQKVVRTIEHLPLHGNGEWYASIFETQSFRSWNSLTAAEAACLEQQFCEMENPI